MTIQDFLKQNVELLSSHGIDTARLDCLVLLSDVLNNNIAHILAHPEVLISDNHRLLLEGFIKRRLKHEPLAYIRKHSEFYGYKFYVNHNVLVPRPESESIISLLLEQVGKKEVTIIDVGTGSGALAITAKLLLPETHVLATDLYDACLQVASHNARMLDTSLTLLQSNLLESLPSTFFEQDIVLLCNLPYVPKDFPINAAAAHEPATALFGGKDGLDLYRLLFDQVRKFAQKNYELAVITEALPQQHNDLALIANARNLKLMKTSGLAQLFANC